MVHLKGSIKNTAYPDGKMAKKMMALGRCGWKKKKVAAEPRD